MAKAFESPRRNSGKGFPRALSALRSFLAGGSVQDFRAVTLAGAGPLEFVAEANEAYEIQLTTGGSQGVEDIDIEVQPNMKVGQLILFTLATLTDSADSVTITEESGAGTTLVTDAASDLTGGAVVSITLAAEGEYALIKYIGNDTFDVVVTDGVVVTV